MQSNVKQMLCVFTQKTVALAQNQGNDIYLFLSKTLKNVRKGGDPLMTAEEIRLTNLAGCAG